jgi:hypothetical protein
MGINGILLILLLLPSKFIRLFLILFIIVSIWRRGYLDPMLIKLILALLQSERHLIIMAIQLLQLRITIVGLFGYFPELLAEPRPEVHKVQVQVSYLCLVLNQYLYVLCYILLQGKESSQCFEYFIRVNLERPLLLLELQIHLQHWRLTKLWNIPAKNP